MEAAKLACLLEKFGTTAILVGGSTVASVSQLDSVIKAIKGQTDLPIILFPNNITGISKHADAIFFMSLLNSNTPHFITGIQALGAPFIKKLGLESIPLGYIIIGEGSSASYIGNAHCIPYNKPNIATMYSLVAQYFGMHFVYLEAGSGSRIPIPLKMIRIVKKNVNIPLIIGGGIRTRANAVDAVKAGANVIVTGTIIERDSSKQTIKAIIEGIKNTNEKS